MAASATSSFRGPLCRRERLVVFRYALSVRLIVDRTKLAAWLGSQIGASVCDVTSQSC